LKQNIQKRMRNMAVVGISGVIIIFVMLAILNLNYSKTTLKNRAMIIASLVQKDLTDKMKVGDIKGLSRVIAELPKDIDEIKSVHIAKSDFIKEEFHVKSSATGQENRVFRTGKMHSRWINIMSFNPVVSISIPYKAKAYCLKCHTNAKIGNILGVISLNLSAKEAQTAALKSFAVAMFVFLVIVGLMIYYMLGNKKIVGAMNTNARAVGSAASDINRSSSQLASASDALAQGAAEQAASLEQIASSMEEIDSMVKQTADNASQANIVAQETAEAAADGMNLVGELIETSNNIKETSNKTAKIIKTIDEIAFQTNLLALNAAVEAARAGEAGAGFAVVAEEVRSLAAKSAEAAKNTAELIAESIDQGAKGVSASNAVAGAIEKLAASAEKAKTLTNEIAEAAAEQTKGIAQINQGIAQLNTVTQQNSAASEEIAASAKEMLGQADNLTTVAGKLAELLGVDLHTSGKESDSSENKLMRPPSAENGKAIVKSPSDVIPLTEDELRKF